MNKIILILFFYFSISLINIGAVDNPTNPDDPALSDKFNENNKQNDSQYNIQFQNQKKEFGKGVINTLNGIYLNLTWKGNDIGAQEILMDFVRSVRIKGYTMVKKERNNLAIVYYFPYIFDIELKDGSIIKDARGRIKELESFTVYNSIGRQKCYTYFIRYWLEDKKTFTDNDSSDYNETPKVPNSVIIYIEFN